MALTLALSRYPLYVLFASVLHLACGGGSQSATGSGLGAPSNPFGVLVGAVDGQATPRPIRIQVSQSLGVRYTRNSNALSTLAWTGSDPDSEAFTASGFKILLTVRNCSAPGAPSTPPIDLAAYSTTLGSMCDVIRPEVVVIENEENSALFYTGTPSDYLAQLQAAASVVHARGLKVTNGGLVSSLAALLTWNDYQTRGLQGQAEDFARRAFDAQTQAILQDLAHHPEIVELIAKGTTLINGYRALDLDFVNFHWYIADAQALGECVAFLRTATGKVVICDEMGQQDRLVSTVNNLLPKALELQLPYVCWFSADGPQAFGLHNASGTLRDTGLAFQTFVKSRWP